MITTNEMYNQIEKKLIKQISDSKKFSWSTIKAAITLEGLLSLGDQNTIY